MKFEKLQYVGILFVLYIDSIIRGLMLILFVRVSNVFILFVFAGYFVYLNCIWMMALGKSMDAPVRQLQIALKKSGLFSLSNYEMP